jgi:ribosome-associated heat shock protein Hsp15
MDRVRLDKWLWAARFFKTRGVATEAVLGGRVHVNGARAKPAKEIAVGDTIEITIRAQRRTVRVTALSDRRGPAAARLDPPARAGRARATARPAAWRRPRGTSEQTRSAPARSAPPRRARPRQLTPAPRVATGRTGAAIWTFRR